MQAPTLQFPPLETQSETWAALRCQSVQTLTLAETLQAQGVAGWSPSAVVRHRFPRKRKAELRIVPLLPSFVFVPFPLADNALELGERGRVPRAWPFLFNGDRPAVPVDQLLAMQCAKPRSNGEQYKAGDSVRFVAGPFQGLTAVVLCRKGRDRWLVDIGGARVLVPGFLIAPVKIKPQLG